MITFWQRIGFRPALAAAALLFLFGNLAPAQEEKEEESPTLKERIQALLSPGPLARAHGDFDKAVGCKKCHVGQEGLADHLCLECHKDIKDRMDSRSGYHGKQKGSCHNCHTEHQGRESAIIDLDEKKFNHEEALFHLRGRHHDLACDDCHAVRKKERKLQKRFYIGLPRDCAGCHDNPHEDQFAGTCRDCHSEAGWKGKDLVFDHRTMSRYPLQGKHLEVACQKCHKGMKRFKPLSTKCHFCHKDPHEKQFAEDKQCESCHTVFGFKGRFLNFDHDADSRYPLDGAHVAVDCAKCHENGAWRHDRMACIDCHEDVHEGQFSPDKPCIQCHQSAGWKGPFLRFDHQKDSNFPLTGQHLLVDCEHCHMEAWYRTEQEFCVDCHDDPHKGKIESDCETCHVTEGFTGSHLTFDHDRDTAFPLTALHVDYRCDRCHPDITYRVKGSTCKICHDDAEAFYAGTSYPGLAPLRRDPMHGLVKCTDCHLLTDAKASASLIRPRCVACHNPDYGHYLNACMGFMASEIQRVLEAGPTDGLEGRKEEALETIRRFSPHNFIYSRKLLDAVRSSR